MDAETLLGAVLIATWAAVVLRGLERTAVAARKGRKWERAYLVGLAVGCAFGVGVVLSIKTPFGLGFLLAAGAGFAIWAFGRMPDSKRKAPVRSKRQIEHSGRMSWACARRSKMPFHTHIPMPHLLIVQRGATRTVIGSALIRLCSLGVDSSNLAGSSMGVTARVPGCARQ